MFADKSNQLVVRETICKIALKLSIERTNISLPGMSSVDTDRMIRRYVTTGHVKPAYSMFQQYGGTIDVYEGF